MTIQNDLRNVTDRIQTDRNLLAKAEFDRIQARAAMAEAETALDTARRNYADLNTDFDRARVVEMQRRVTAAEIAVTAHAAALRIHEDERRYLELVVRLTIAGIVEVSPARQTLTYASGNDDDQGGEDNFFYGRDVAEAVARVAR